MLVGIDARRYSAGGRGQERYIRSLVHALAVAPSDHRFLLFINREPALPPKTEGRMRFSPARFRLRLQHRLHLSIVPRVLMRGVDLVHFPLADGWYQKVCPTVVTIHDLSVLLYPEAYVPDPQSERRAWEHHRRITSSADAVIAVSHATRRDILRLLQLPDDRVQVVPHGLEPMFRSLPSASAKSIQDRYALPERYLLFIGGIDFKKNVERLIAGFALALRMERLPQSLVLAGTLQQAGNPSFDAARRRADEEGVADRVVWAGYVLEDDLAAMYWGADALVFPSIMEGFGLPVLEAMACGTPVVTSAGSAMSEIAGKNAVYIEPLETESIAEGIVRLVRDEPLRRHLAEEGLRQAAAYTWERTATMTVQVYERAANQASVAGQSATQTGVAR